MFSKPARRKIARGIDWILGAHPYLSSIVYNWKIESSAKVQNIGTDGKGLFYNPDFVKGLTQLQTSWCLLHEAGHVFLGHHLRGSQRRKRLQWNQASDLALNSLIARELGCPKDVLKADGFGLPFDKPAEWYYGALGPDEDEDEQGGPQEPPEGGQGGNEPQPKPQPQPGDEPSGDGAQGPGDSGDSGEPWTVWGEVLPTSEDPETARREWEQQVAEGLLRAKAVGNCPGWVQEIAQDILAPPIPDTKQILRQFFSRTVREGYTYTRPNRRRSHMSGLILPSRRSRSLGDVALIVDTSGSMSVEECNIALRWIEETLATFRRATVTAIQADTRVIEEATKTYSAYDFPLDPRQIAWHGRGGTNLSPAIEFAAKLRPACLVIVTDMEWDWQHAPNPGLPTIWINTSNREHGQPHYGILVNVPEKRGET
jgi:predicted metal-dependent peptidase